MNKTVYSLERNNIDKPLATKPKEEGRRPKLIKLEMKMVYHNR
jgi:hypothetical protein